MFKQQQQCMKKYGGIVYSYFLSRKKYRYTCMDQVYSGYCVIEKACRGNEEVIRGFEITSCDNEIIQSWQRDK